MRHCLRVEHRAGHGLPARGMTLLEVVIAMFIFLVGIVGVLGAMPTGVSAAHTVIFQDAAIHLSRSKFAEFRRDRIDPRVDLVIGSTYLDAGSAPPRKQEPQNGNPGGWRDFAHTPGDAYENFDRYQWLVEQSDLKPVCVDTGNNNVPAIGIAPGVVDVSLTQVTLVIGLKGSKREFRFTQYMYSYGN